MREREFDDAFPDGVFAFPPNPKEPRVKVEYCKEKGVTPDSLTEEEMNQFVIFD